MAKRKVNPRRLVSTLIAVGGIASLVVVLASQSLPDRLLDGILSPRSVFLQAAPWLPAAAEQGEPDGAAVSASAYEHIPGSAEPNLDAEETFAPIASASSIEIEPLEVEPDVPDAIRIELLDIAPAKIDLSGNKPKILIYHTHFTEAYTPTKKASYVETAAFRTDDTKNNVVAVGDALTKALEKYGIEVLHDKTNHEPPKLGTSYERSVLTMLKYQQKYPSIEIFIDLHRDAYELPEGQSENSDYAVIDGKKVARIMFVVGTGEGKTGEGFSQKPDFKANYALAKAISDQLNTINPALTRPIRVKTGRYNQHVGRCLLVEVGHNCNTLEEALNAVDYLAKAIAKAGGIT